MGETIWLDECEPPPPPKKKKKNQLERRLREALLRPIICHHEIEAYQPQTSIIYVKIHTHTAPLAACSGPPPPPPLVHDKPLGAPAFLRLTLSTAVRWSRLGGFLKVTTRMQLPNGLVCSSSQLAPRIGLYAASLVSLTDVLIGWRASDCDASTHIVTYPNKHGEYPPSPTWRASPTWRKQKAFPLPVEKSREFPAFFRGRGQSYARRHGTWNSLQMAKLHIKLIDLN